MNKIKVLVIAGTMNMGGLENQLMHLLRKADKARFQIDFACTSPNPYYKKEIITLGGKCYSISPMNWKWPLPYCRALYKIMKNGQYDVIHTNELFHSGIVLKVAHAAGVKGRVVHAHSFSDSDGINSRRSFIRTVYNAIMQYWILKYSTEQIACSSPAGRFLYGEKFINKSTYHLIYNSIDTTKYIEQYDQSESGEFCGDGWTNVLHVGRIYPVKRQLFDIDIAGQIKKSGKKIRILCAGSVVDEDYMEQIRNLIQEKNLQEYMIMLGSRSDIDVLFRKSAVAILPSVYEGMPLVMIEAQASGVPCVVSDTFSHEVDFEIGMVQWLSSSASAEVWLGAIEKAIMMGRAEKQEIIRVIDEKKFDSRKFAEEVCNIYEKSLKVLDN